MSNATTVADAQDVHLKDLKRLTSSRDELIQELEHSAQVFSSRAFAMRLAASEASQAYLVTKKAEVDATIDAALASKNL